jgi:alcohol dehydrogenase YqhD (iron-dependent ADH family)
LQRSVAMQNFVFENPTKIIFGKDRIEKVGEEVKRFGTRVLFVYGQGSIKKHGVYDRIIASLQEAGVAVVEFGGVKSNPVLSHALKGIELARSEKTDVVLAAGGGSVMDTAKAIAVGAKASPDQDMWDFFTFKQRIKAALPIITVVTVSASASEMNSAAVITREDTSQKYTIQSPLIQPKTSILDPTMLFTLSPQYSAYSTVDAITHMLEGYFNNTEPMSPLQDRLVEGLIHTMMESMDVILKDPHNYDARANTMWAVVLAFNGLTTAGMGRIAFPSHMIEHSLSALYDIAHGAGLSIVLPAWMKYAAHLNPPKFARFAREIFNTEKTDDLNAALDGIDRLKEFFVSIGSPVSLKDANIPSTDIEKIADNAAGTARLWGMRSYTQEVIADILTLSAE